MFPAPQPERPNPGESSTPAAPQQEPPPPHQPPLPSADPRALSLHRGSVLPGQMRLVERNIPAVGLDQALARTSWGAPGPLVTLLAAALCGRTSAARPRQPCVLTAVCGFRPLCGLGFTSPSTPKVTDARRDPGGFELASGAGCDSCLSASLPGLAACAGPAAVPVSAHFGCCLHVQLR